MFSVLDSFTVLFPTGMQNDFRFVVIVPPSASPPPPSPSASPGLSIKIQVSHGSPKEQASESVVGLQDLGHSWARIVGERRAPRLRRSRRSGGGRGAKRGPIDNTPELELVLLGPFHKGERSIPTLLPPPPAKEEGGIIQLHRVLEVPRQEKSE